MGQDGLLKPQIRGQFKDLSPNPCDMAWAGGSISQLSWAAERVSLAV